MCIEKLIIKQLLAMKPLLGNGNCESQMPAQGLKYHNKNIMILIIQLNHVILIVGSKRTSKINVMFTLQKQ